MQQRAGVEDRHQPVAAVGAAALHDLAIDGGDLAAALDADLQPDVGGRPAAVRQEAFLARQLHPDRAAGRARQCGGDHLEVERLDAVAEAAADEGFDDADARAVHAQHPRQRQVQVVRHLGHRVRRQAVALGLVGGHRGIELDLAVRHLGIGGAALQHQVGRREAAVDVAEILLHLALDVAGLVVVQQHRVLGARIGSAEVRGQRLEIEHDRAQCRLGGGLVDGGHRGHRLAAVAHLVARQWPLVLRDRDHTIGCGEVLAGDHRAHARDRACRRGVDGADQGVRHRAAQDATDQRLAEGQVGGVARAAGDLLDAVDERCALSDPTGRAVRGAHRAPPAAARTDSMIFT